MAASNSIRVGIIGYGYAGKTFHAPLIGATPGLALSVVASGDPVKVHADFPHVEVVADPMALVASSEVDLVVIATPNDTHLPLARAALAAGKDVVVDKPFTLTLADARELVAAAQRSKRLISAFHNRRWDSDYLSIKAAIAGGLVGHVVHFESHFDRYRPDVRQRWRESNSPGGGVWFDLGPHLVDQALQLFGLPDRVQANFAKQRCASLVEDWSHVVLEYRSRRVLLHAAMLAAGGFHRFLVHGQKGSVVKHKPDQQEAQLIAGMNPGDRDWGTDPDELSFFDGSGALSRSSALAGDQRCYYRNIAAALRGEAVNPVTPAQILAVMAVIEAALSSARLGATMDLALDADERGAFARDTQPVQA
jgi:predicted dehydrogenase